MTTPTTIRVPQGRGAPAVSRAAVAVLVSAALLACALRAAVAQDARASSTVVEPLVLEEVVVTARKREESLRDVPLTVTAVTADAIERLGIRDAYDVALYTPGFSNVASFGRNSVERPVIRGQSNILGDPNASYFVDGVYLSGSTSNTETANLERIEVIKGPQAVLYGRATFAGAINFVTRKPSDEFEGKVTATLGQHDQRDFGAWVSGPVIDDRLAFYAAVSHLEYGGAYDNPLDPRDELGAESTKAGTLKLRWTPDDATEVTALVTAQQDDDGPLAMGLQGREFNNCQLPGPALPRSRGYYCGVAQPISKLTIQQRTDLFTDPGISRDRVRAALTAKVGFGAGYEAVSVTGWSHEDYAIALDASYAGYDAFGLLDSPALPPPAPGAAGDPTRQFRNKGAFWRVQEERREDFSQELRLRSPADRAFRWTLGAYYFKQSDDLTRDDKVTPDVRTVPNGAAALFLRDLKNEALFGGIEYDLSERWTATAELRHARDTRRQEGAQYSTTPVAPSRCAPGGDGILVSTSPTSGCIVSSGVRVPFTALEETFKSDKPRFTLRWKPTDDLTLFANYAEGNKPGGFNPPAVLPLLEGSGKGAAYDEEESVNIELGGKFRLLDGRVYAAVTLFDTELTNQQLTQNIVGVNAAGSVIANSYIENVGKTDSRGVEFELTARLTERLDISMGGSYVDAIIRKHLNQDQADLYSNRPSSAFSVVSVTNPGGCGTPGASAAANAAACLALRNLDNAQFGDVAGKRAPRAPEYNGYAVVQYTLPLSDGVDLALGGDVVYEGSKFSQVHNLIETGDRTYLNARIGLEGRSWSVSLWGKNLADDDTALDILRYIDSRNIPSPATRGFAITLPRPRQIGMTATLKF
jgi:outer membrane receptor protein involved in Fe transport